jgi:hypothetical protein
VAQTSRGAFGQLPTLRVCDFPQRPENSRLQTLSLQLRRPSAGPTGRRRLWCGHVHLFNRAVLEHVAGRWRRDVTKAQGRVAAGCLASACSRSDTFKR